jgi:ferritin-like metal-binding protein YciE
MAKEAKTLDDLFHDTLKDIYYAEKKILATLPKMAKAAQSEELRAAFEKHQSETEEQIGRLEQVFAAHRQEAPGQNVRRHRRHHRRRCGDHEGVQGFARA